MLRRKLDLIDMLGGIEGEARVIEMIKGGIDTKRCQDYLAAHAPAFVNAFLECVAQAELEQD